MKIIRFLRKQQLKVILVIALILPMILPAQQIIQFKNDKKEKGAIGTIKHPVSDTILFDAINRSLKATTSVCISSFATEVLGSVLIGSSINSNLVSEGDLNEAGTNIFLGIWTSIGGFGTTTNVPILANRAYRQLKAWDCPADQTKFKSGVLLEINIAKTLSILQTLTPLVALAGEVIINSINPGNDHAWGIFGENHTWGIFGVIYFAGSLLVIPEVILFEHARHKLNEYAGKMTLGPNRNGIGISYKF